MTTIAPPKNTAGVLELPGPIGFVMSGGASLGSVQVGMLQALASAGVHPDFIVGTSVGALNAAIPCHRRRCDRLPRRPGPSSEVATCSPALLSSIWRLGRTRTHAVGTGGLERIAARALRVDTFADLQIPLGVVTVDLTRGRPRVEAGPWCSSGPAGSATSFPPGEDDTCSSTGPCSPTSL